MDYNEHVRGVVVRVGNLESTLRSLEDKKKLVLEELEVSIREEGYLRRVFDVSKNMESFYQWSTNIRYGKEIVYEYKSAEYDFTILIDERNDLKKWRWEVRVYVRKQVFGDHYRYRGYVDYEYDKKRYCRWEQSSKGDYQWAEIEGGVKLKDKFTSIEDAKKFAFDWMIRLEDDHREDLEREKGLVGFFKQEDFDFNTIFTSR